MKANERQIGGSHYRQDYQHWDFAADTPLNYFEANITKYITRWRSKNGVDDVKKAAHYLQKLIELYQQRRMVLPFSARFVYPLQKFLKQTKNVSELERKIFEELVLYTSLEQLCTVRQLVEKLLVEARKITK
jgi:hypothetical protein